jgi:AcrR family transcriptional regulator
VSPRPRVAAERRAAIVRATIRCLARDGYACLTMKRVAAEAGVSPGILHYYFRDKRAILGRAAATVMADLDRRVATEARDARDARGHLRAQLRACLEVATESRDFWTVFNVSEGQHGSDAGLKSTRPSYGQIPGRGGSAHDHRERKELTLIRK